MQFNNLVETLQYRAEHTPGDISYSFLTDGETIGQQFTYAQLDMQARVIGATLQQLTQKGERALMLYPSGLDFVAAFMGCQFSGVVAVPALPPNLNRIQTTIDRLLGIMQDAKPTIILTTSDLLMSIKTATQSYPEFQGVTWQATNNLQSGRAFLWEEPELQANDLSFLQYTSGSTSKPKGVMVSHGNLMYNMAMLTEAIGLGEKYNFVSWLPLFHDLGLIGVVLNNLYVGGEARLMSPMSFLKKPLRWLKAISEHTNVCSGGPNFAFDLCLRKIKPEELEGLDLSEWNCAFSGAETVRAHTLKGFNDLLAPQGFKKSALMPCFGLAEATLMVSARKPGADFLIQRVQKEGLAQGNVIAVGPEDEAGLDIVSCGTTKQGQEIAIVNPETCERLGDLEVGEIWITGAHIARGYWQNKTKSEEAFNAVTTDGSVRFLRTGDLGYMDQGELYITGRIKEIILVRGRCLYPQDLELLVDELAENFPEIRPNGSVSFALSNKDAERVGLIVEVNRRKNKAYDPEKLISEIQKQALAKFETGFGEIALVKSSIPKTSSGKKMRTACRKMMVEGITENMTVEHHWIFGGEAAELQATPTELPTAKAKKDTDSVTNLLSREELESILIEWIAEEQKVDSSRITTTQPITDFGLDSLAAVTLVEFLEKKLDTALDTNLVFEVATIEELASHLEGKQ